MHYHTTDIQPVLIWSPDKDLEEKSIILIREEYQGRIMPFTTEQIGHKVGRLTEAELEEEIAKFNFHVIKVKPTVTELILLDNMYHKRDENIKWEDGLRDLIHEILEHGDKSHEHSHYS